MPIDYRHTIVGFLIRSDANIPLTWEWLRFDLAWENLVRKRVQTYVRSA